MVFVPGVTGSELVDPATGEVVWGRGWNTLFPRDGGYGLALPVAPEREGERLLEPFEVWDEVRLGPLVQPIYGPLLEALESWGYRRGELAAPEPGETLFGFAYEWRRSNVASARALLARLAALREARGGGRLVIDLVCQSNGAHVCRYLVRHGGASLDEAEAGAGAPPWLAVRNVVLVAGSNGGALRILRELHRGRIYVPLVGRRMLPEVLFTFRSLYQDLPHDPEGRFVDGSGYPLEVDLYDPETWARFGWSVLAPEVERRLARRGREDLFGDREERRRYLGRVLSDARRFQRLLGTDPGGFEPPCYHLVGNAYAPTPQRAVLERVRAGSGRDGGPGERWWTHFAGDPELEREPYLRALASAPGDDHATLASQLALSPRERAHVAGQPFLVQGGHFDLILDPATHRRVWEALQTPGC